MCPRTLSDRHDQTETDRALWFFSTRPQRTPRIHRLVSGQSDAWLWRNRDFPTEDEDLEKCALELFWTATIKLRQIERSGFFLLNHNGQTRVYRLVSG